MTLMSFTFTFLSQVKTMPLGYKKEQHSYLKNRLSYVVKLSVKTDNI